MCHPKLLTHTAKQDYLARHRETDRFFNQIRLRVVDNFVRRSYVLMDKENRGYLQGVADNQESQNMIFSNLVVRTRVDNNEDVTNPARSRLLEAQCWLTDGRMDLQATRIRYEKIGTSIAPSASL